jgi:uncharacterized protein with PIN domain
MPGRTAFEELTGSGALGLLAALVLAAVLPAGVVGAQESEDCLMCHGDRDLTAERKGRTVSLYVSERRFGSSVHADLTCVGCHMDLTGLEDFHDTPLEKVDCGACHDEIQEQHAGSLHGQALERGDRLAPRCIDCHGVHGIRPVSDHDSPVSPLQVPFTCGRCHQEGSPVTEQREIHQDHILENFSESIHGEGLLRKGLIVAPTCASCHTAHNILPHTDRGSSIARANIARTCTQCHAEIESVHQQVIRGELWEKEAHVLPACADCHPPHKIRKVFYDQGMADAECLECHGQEDLVAGDGRPLFVRREELRQSRHVQVACSQCHSGVNVSRKRPCETITQRVDCDSCHAEVGQNYEASIHGQLFARNDPNAPTCKECHGRHEVLGRLNPTSPIFATNIPALCARCHREGEQAAVRYQGPEHLIVEHYTESIHGKGLLKSGLVVTATCTNCHTPHGALPTADPASSVNPDRVADTCGTCHHGIHDVFEQSVHGRHDRASEKDVPTCADCHSAHTIRRADVDGFKLDIMQRCGRCHEEIASTYFDTYHGKVSQLGYTKTAKCYDCHGAHDILPVSDPRSHLSRENVVETCQKCHPGATRRFAGYLTHATHHDPDKYPWLFWTFWGMTGLLVGTFVVSGAHTLLWLPRAVQMRRELREAEEAEARAIEAGAPLLDEAKLDPEEAGPDVEPGPEGGE